MLILTRKKGERIILANGLITFQIVDVKGGKVRVGVQAPEDVSVHREEIQQRIEADSQERRDGQG